jgi:virginiamycin A acetyltransferase
MQWSKIRHKIKMTRDKKQKADTVQIELKSCLGSGVLFRLYKYRWMRRLCLKIILRYESGELFSQTLRRILTRYHGVTVGAYSYGECMIPGRFPSGVTVGRYVSMGPGVRVFLRNHPLQRLTMHPFFFNSALGVIAKDTIETGSLEIGHDAWIGANVIVVPGCKRIGIGAVIGAGAIVTKDVPDFAIVLGNPGKQVRLRFSEEICTNILKSKWWERSLSECLPHVSEIVKPIQKENGENGFIKTCSMMNQKEGKIS